MKTLYLYTFLIFIMHSGLCDAQVDTSRHYYIITILKPDTIKPKKIILSDSRWFGPVFPYHYGYSTLGKSTIYFGGSIYIENTRNLIPDRTLFCNMMFVNDLGISLIYRGNNLYKFALRNEFGFSAKSSEERRPSTFFFYSIIPKFSFETYFLEYHDKINYCLITKFGYSDCNIVDISYGYRIYSSPIFDNFSRHSFSITFRPTLVKEFNSAKNDKKYKTEPFLFQ